LNSGEFVYRRQIQYRDTDASGIVHFTVFFILCEEAEHAMWREQGLSVEPRLTEIGWPRVSACCEFLRPLRFEDHIEVRLRVIGKTSKTLRYQAVIVHDGKVAAAGTMTTICVDKRPGQPLRAIAIPTEIADRFTVVSPIEVPGFRGLDP
jgi:4-hydroxybenzoyl-CoA thioesterase/acyl-CoA thioester hydrolase